MSFCEINGKKLRCHWNWIRLDSKLVLGNWNSQKIQARKLMDFGKQLYNDL